MDPASEVHVSAIDVLQGSLNEDFISHVPPRKETFGSEAEGNAFLDVLQSKHGHYGSLLALKISELMKLGGLENIPMRSLFNIMNGIIEEQMDKKDQDIPQRVACMLKLVVQEIELRVSKQSENSRKQNNLFKSCEALYQSRTRALETLVTGTGEENEILMNQIQQLKNEKSKIEERKKLEEQDLVKLRNEKEARESEIFMLTEELKSAKKAYEESCLYLEAKAKESNDKLHSEILELEYLLTKSREKNQELEDFTESKVSGWKRKERGYRHIVDSQFGLLQELRLSSDSMKHEVSNIKNVYAEEFYRFGVNLRGLIDAAQNYNKVLEENRKLYNEVQDLKGNIRVYCRIRPFLPGQSEKQTTMQYIGDNGELIVVNPLKPGKDSHRLFKFNKVFGPASTQEEIFQDTQPLIRSVLDGYSVCIFAYGQTGSGKTYTMTGPLNTSVGDWGVNYRALNDLFIISQNRRNVISYDVSVQMVEIYNEQVRDLLCDDSSQKRLGIWNTAQPNGLSVPDASMHSVKSTTDVLELMNLGLANRAVGATALNERSSRSHSILSVHVRGTDLKTFTVLRGCLHLVDLAGSERVERSEATGERLREAQNINKSLSALGDVIFALAQKSSHVPYRNSKLTQVLQSSLGGQAKTLMFVQLNPDVKSYSETVSTLKFAERVSGVELGAARSNKEGRSVRDLMEQVSFLKDLVAKKDEEIGQLQLLKTIDGYVEEVPMQPIQKRLPREKNSSEKAVLDLDNISENRDKHSKDGSKHSMNHFKYQQELFQQSRPSGVVSGCNFSYENGSKHEVADAYKNPNEDFERWASEDADSEERHSDISDGLVSLGTETEVSINTFVETTKSFAETTEKSILPTEIPRPPVLKYGQGQAGSSRIAFSNSSSEIPNTKRGSLGLAKDCSKSQVRSTSKLHKRNFL